MSSASLSDSTSPSTTTPSSSAAPSQSRSLPGSSVTPTTGSASPTSRASASPTSASPSSSSTPSSGTSSPSSSSISPSQSPTSGNSSSSSSSSAISSPSSGSASPTGSSSGSSSTASASSSSSSSSIVPSSSSTSTSVAPTSTSFVVVTTTDSSGVHTTSRAVTGADAGNSTRTSGTNTGAIVGGVVGGVVGLLALLALLWFFCFRRRKNSEVAFDEKTFDPGNRHSVADPIDLLAPSVPNVGNPETAGLAATHSPHVDPFPYGPDSAANQAYDPYSHAPMQMPDHNNYLGGGYGAYGGGDGGYAVAAMGGAAAGAAGAGAYSASQYSSEPSHYGGVTSPPQQQSHFPVPTVAPGVAAKQREAQAERDRLRNPYGSGPSREAATSPDARRTSQLSDGGSQSVYQHTDMTSMPDEEGAEAEGPSEIPPNYHSIRR